MTQTVTRPLPTKPVTIPEPPPEIKRGVEWLDGHFPTWEYRIDVDRLDVESNIDCVIAQVTGRHALRAFAAIGFSRMQVYHYGFVAAKDPALLSALWKDYIRARLHQT